MNGYFIAAMIICALLAAFFIVVRVLRGGVYGLIAKAVASVSFFIAGIVLTLVAGEPVLFKVLFWVGLFFGVAGDVLLDFRQVYPLKKNNFLNAGMLAFGIGHACYLSAMILYAMQYVNVTLGALTALIAFPITAVAIFVVVRVLKMNMKGFIAKSFGYTLILVYIALYAFALTLAGGVPKMELYTIGAFLFLTSDMLLCTQYFGGQEKNKILTILNHIFYYAAQLIYVSMLFFAV